MEMPRFRTQVRPGNAANLCIYKKPEFSRGQKWVWSLSSCTGCSNHKINIAKRFYDLENITLEYYLKSLWKNQNFQNCMRIEVLRKQLFARK